MQYTKIKNAILLTLLTVLLACAAAAAVLFSLQNTHKNPVTAEAVSYTYTFSYTGSKVYTPWISASSIATNSIIYQYVDRYPDELGYELNSSGNQIRAYATRIGSYTLTYRLYSDPNTTNRIDFTIGDVPSAIGNTASFTVQYTGSRVYTEWFVPVGNNYTYNSASAENASPVGYEWGQADKYFGNKGAGLMRLYATDIGTYRFIAMEYSGYQYTLVVSRGTPVTKPKWSDSSTSCSVYYTGVQQYSLYTADALPTGVNYKSTTASGYGTSSSKYRIYATNAGSYTITFSLSSGYYWADSESKGDYSLTFIINKAIISGTTYISTSYTYNGTNRITSIAGVSISSTTPLASSSYAPPTTAWSLTSITGTTASGSSWSGTTTGPVNAGSYTASWTLSSDYTKNFSGYSTCTTPFTIDKAVITVSWSGDKFSYTGGPQAPVISGLSFNAAMDDSYKPKATNFTFTYKGRNTTSYSSSTAPTAQGEYTVTATLASAYRNNFATASDNTAAYTVAFDFSIVKPVPDVSGIGFEGYTVTYDGAAHYIVPTGTEVLPAGVTGFSVAYKLGTTAVADPVSAGAYTATLTFTVTNLYTAPDPKTATLTISKATINVTVTGYGGIYDGAAHNVASYSANTVNNQAVTWYFGTSANPASTTVPTVTNYTAGTTYYYRATAPNHADATGSFTVTVDKKDIASGVTWSNIPQYTFTGNAYTPRPVITRVGGVAVTSTGMFSYDYENNTGAGTATVTVTGISGNFTGEASLNFIIKKAVVNSITWDNLSFTYTGAEQCPALTALTTATAVNVAKPLSMFEITGGQVVAGNHTATATLIPEYAINFTTSATDESAKQFKTEYVINKAALELSFILYGGMHYNGLAQLPETELTVPSTVTESARPALSGLKTTVKAKPGSHLTKGGAVDVGSYTVTYTLPSALAKNFTLNGSTTVTSAFSIEKAALNISWTWTDSKAYNGSKQGPEVEEFTDVPEHGEDPKKCVSTTYYGANGEKLTGAPVHQGSYSVTVKFTNDNYGFAKILYDGTVTTEPSKTVNFTITPVSYVTDGVEITWRDLTDLKYTGKPQGPVLAGDYYGRFTGDSGTKLNLTLTYAKVGETEFVSDKYTNAGKYIVRVTEEHGDYTFEDEEFEIAKRGVRVTWTGDNYSRTDDGALKWLYDGKEHKPGYTLSFGEGVEILGGDKVKLIYGGRTAIGAETIKAKLSEADKLNFEFADGTENLNIEIEKFAAEKVEWYDYGGEALTEAQLADLSYEYTMVYGAEGPKLSAKAIMVYHADEEDIEVCVDLYVRYPSYHNGYWWDKNGETTYKAIAEFKTADANNGCEFSEAVLKDDNGTQRVFITFVVTDIRTALEKITISWVITVDGEQTDITEIGEYSAATGYGWLNGEFTFVYNGEKQYPTPVAVNAEGRTVYVALTESGKHSEVGSYTVHLSALNGYEFSRADSECRYGIAPREITLNWPGEDSFEYTGEVPYIKADVSEDSVNTLLAGDTVKASLDNANAGTHNALAAVYTGGKVNNNYIISNAEKVITISRKPVSVKNIDWSKTKESGATESLDASGKIYYVWVNDGKEHSPAAELNVEILGERVQLSLIVLGSASATGTYTAYAVLDESDSYNKNFVLVADETNHTETIASQRFDISRISITKITWTAGKDGSEKLEYVYDGKAHKPYAVCETSDGRTIELNVFGAQTDAGTYTAYVTDNYAYESGVEKSAGYKILPRTVKVTWGEETEFIYDGLPHAPEAEAEGLSKEDYSVTGKADAGEYVAEIVFASPNYTGDKSECAYKILKREVTVSWTGSGYTPSKAEEGVLYYIYNGAGRCPVASGSFIESIANRIIVSGKETNVGRYEATAVLDGSIPENANYTLKEASKQFEILPYEIKVVWTGNEGVYEWEYDGEQHAPTARYELWDGWHAAEVLGARVNAGENYIASVALPGNCVFAKVGGVSSGERKYTIKKCEVNRIEWYADAEKITDKTGFTFEYNGLAQVPVAKVPETGEELIVTGAMINAGSGYIATAALKDEGNYEFGAEVNNEYEYGIRAKTVWIKWLGNTDGTFVWEYTGGLISPEAQLEDKDHNVIVEDGNPVKVTVTGANISAGDSYKATAHDTFTNYEFAKDASITRNYTITAISLGEDFTWDTNGGAVTGVRYTYEYNGKVQQPTAKVEGKPEIRFSYTITDKDGNEVTAIVNAGEYEVTVKASDSNVTIPTPTVTVVITAKEVEVDWEDVTDKLPYTGEEQAPKAYYTDINGLKVEFKVSGGVISGNGEAEAGFAETDNEYGNYVLKESSARTSFEVEEKATGNYVYNWETGKFELEPETEA